MSNNDDRNSWLLTEQEIKEPTTIQEKIYRDRKREEEIRAEVNESFPRSNLTRRNAIVELRMFMERFRERHREAYQVWLGNSPNASLSTETPLDASTQSSSRRSSIISDLRYDPRYTVISEVSENLFPNNGGPSQAAPPQAPVIPPRGSSKAPVIPPRGSSRAPVIPPRGSSRAPVIIPPHT